MHSTLIIALWLLGVLWGTLILREAPWGGSTSPFPGVPRQVFGVAAEQAGCRGSEGAHGL